MLACDLDGTLLGPDGSISERTAAALAAAREAGITITLVTGRPPRWLSPVADQTGWHGLAVAANGAVLVDLEKRIVERTFPIELPQLVVAIERVRELLPGAVFAVERVQAGTRIPEAAPDVPHAELQKTRDPSDFGHEPGYKPRLAVPARTPVGPVEELIDTGDVVKLLARGPRNAGNDPDKILELIQESLAGVVTVTHSTSQDVLLEMSRHGTSKATGVAWLARSHGIDRVDVIAVGDMPNDLPMLLWAGEGWAMANAHPAVQLAVGEDRVLPSHAEHGVAHLIERLLAAHTAADRPGR